MSDFDFGNHFQPAADRLATEHIHRKRLAEKVIPFNVAFLDDVALGIYPTDLIVVSAASGAGKTTIAALLSQLATAQGRVVHFFALEAHRAEIEQRMLFREVVDVCREKIGKHVRLTFGEWLYGKACIPDAVEEEARSRLAEQTLGLKTYYRERDFTHEDITRLFLSIQNETDLIVLDHLHYVDSDDANENRALKATAKAIRDAALGMEKPVIVVAHLRKKDRSNPRLIPEKDDVHGASDIVKVATKVIMLAPARDQQSSDPSVSSTYVQVVKDRFQGENGFAAVLQYDLCTLRYRDPYILGRLNFAGDEFEPTPSNVMPSWAKRAIRSTPSPRPAWVQTSEDEE